MTFPGHTVEIIRIEARLESRQGGGHAGGSHIFDPLNRVNDFFGNQYFFFHNLKRGYQEKLSKT